jgi:hypothetical protein
VDAASGCRTYTAARVLPLRVRRRSTSTFSRCGWPLSVVTPAAASSASAYDGGVGGKKAIFAATLDVTPPISAIDLPFSPFDSSLESGAGSRSERLLLFLSDSPRVGFAPFRVLDGFGTRESGEWWCGDGCTACEERTSSSQAAAVQGGEPFHACSVLVLDGGGLAGAHERTSVTAAPATPSPGCSTIFRCAVIKCSIRDE